MIVDDDYHVKRENVVDFYHRVVGREDAQETYRVIDASLFVDLFHVPFRVLVHDPLSLVHAVVLFAFLYHQS